MKLDYAWFPALLSYWSIIYLHNDFGIILGLYFDSILYLQCFSSFELCCNAGNSSILKQNLPYNSFPRWREGRREGIASFQVEFLSNADRENCAWE